jgi:large subunit ribosomal protein L22
MTAYKYALQGFENDKMARAVARDAEMSPKVAIEICNYLRHRKLRQAQMLLQEVLDMKRAIPFKRFTHGLGHRRGKMASGRYPQKASEIMLKLLNSVEANAQTKGLNASELEITHLCAQRASEPAHYGRSGGGRHFKRAHVEVGVKETAAKKEGAEKKAAKKEKKPAKEQKA